MKIIEHALNSPIFQKLFLLSLFMVFPPASVYALPDGDPVVYGSRVTIHSEVLNEDRELLISIPNLYHRSNQPLPVLYVLDGKENFHHISSLVRFLASSETIPQLLVVAVANTNRNRDFYTPSDIPSDKQIAPGAGGADNFLRFLETELIPWVDSHYRTTDYRMLFGHSAGGYFTLYTLLESPHIFSAYIAASPALHWNDEYILTLADKKKTEKELDDETVFMSVGAEGQEPDRQLGELAATFDKFGSEKLHHTLRSMPSENHFTSPHKTFYQALGTVFKGWYVKDPLALFDAEGVQGLHQHFARMDKKFGLDRGTPHNVIRLLGGLFFEQDRLDDLAELVMYDPYRYTSPPEGLNEIARRYQARGDVDNAIKFYTQALSANASNQVARKKLAELQVDVDEVIDEVAPDASLLQQFAGKYRMPNGNIWEFQAKDRGLIALFNGTTQPLIMRSPTEYTFGFSTVLLEFSPEEDEAELKVRYISTNWEEAVKIE